ncbi:MAG: allophanate hydrolase subunit 2 family protein, partial [Stackebrandtia sp.]
MIEIVAPGPLATVQDLGRPGLAALGVGESGAADRR